MASVTRPPYARRSRPLSDDRLAVINEIGTALAKQLDFDEICEVVGERVRSIFQAPSVAIGLLDESSRTISWPYELDDGQRIHSGPLELGSGLTSIVISTRQPLRAGTSAELDRLGAVLIGVTVSESWLGVPILSGERVIGLIDLESTEQNVFSSSDERLLVTIAASMGVALENARLFGETKRLLSETDERAAELAVINEIGTALASQLEFDAIVQVVGERIRSLFSASSIYIAILDPTTRHFTFPYAINEGVPEHRRSADAAGAGLDLDGHRASGARAVRHARRAGTARHRSRGPPVRVVAGGADPAGETAVGVLVVESMARDAYGDRDISLLSTIAASMGVALENARLFDETKRLLTEADERAAELAIINEVQHGLAERLDMQAMYEVVGAKIQQIFDAQVVDIGIVDPQSGEIHFPYTIERGVRYPDDPMAIQGPRKHVLETRQPLVLNERASERVTEMGQASPVLSGRASAVGRLRAARRRRRSPRCYLAPEPGPGAGVQRRRRPAIVDARRESQRRP